MLEIEFRLVQMHQTKPCEIISLCALVPRIRLDHLTTETMSRGTSRNPDGAGSNKNAGVLETPGPNVLRRENRSNPSSRGGRRSAQEAFNRAHALWAGKEYSKETGVLSNARCRQIRRKIRRALYSGDDESRLEKGMMNYREASKKHGIRLHTLRRRLDASFHLLEMAEDSWAADLFIQEVFQIDRKYKPAADGWVHPRQRSGACAMNRGIQTPPNAEKSHRSAESASVESPAMSDVNEEDDSSAPTAEDREHEEHAKSSSEDEDYDEPSSVVKSGIRRKNAPKDDEMRDTRMKELQKELERLRSKKAEKRHSTIRKKGRQRTLGTKRKRAQRKLIPSAESTALKFR